MFNLYLDQVWGTTNGVPDWSSTTAVESAEDWDPACLTTRVLSILRYEWDVSISLTTTSSDYFKDIYGAEGLMKLLDANEALAEAGGVERLNVSN